MHAAHQLLQQFIFVCVLFLGCSQSGFVQTASVPFDVKVPNLSHGPYTGKNYYNIHDIQEDSFIILVKLNDTTNETRSFSDPLLKTGVRVTPTQSISNITLGPVIVTFKFFTPVDTDDLKRLSLPVSYIAVSVQSTDNLTHPVQIFMGWKDKWVFRSSFDGSRWGTQQLGPLIDIYAKQENQIRISKDENFSQRGKFHVFTNSHGTTFGIDNWDDLQSNFKMRSRLRDLTNQVESFFIQNYPGIGFVKDMIAGPSPSPNVFIGLSRVLRPAINTTDGPMNYLWEDFFNGDEKEMIKFAFDDAEGALARCEALDAKIMADADQHGGQSYSNLVSMALRQAFGGIEFIGTQTHPKAFVKNKERMVWKHGDCQRFDLIYANMPVHLYLNPKILKYLLEPLFVYQESEHITKQWALSAESFRYTHCIGGHDEVLGVEQSGSMIIMIDAYVRASNDTDFATKHYTLCKKWAEHLVSNGLYPVEELTSDALWKQTTNSTNLSLKAIVGIAAMADIAQRVNNTADYARYRSIAENYTVQWIRLSQDPKQSHIKFSYNDETGDSWVLLYNLYADFLLETNLIPNDVVMQQQLWYLSMASGYGIPLGTGTTMSKLPWLLFTAAASPMKIVRTVIYDRVARIRENFYTTDFSDSFDVKLGVPYSYFTRQTNLGGIFAPLTTFFKNTTLSCG